MDREQERKVVAEKLHETYGSLWPKAYAVADELLALLREKD